MVRDELRAEPPWHLAGSGWIIVYGGAREWMEARVRASGTPVGKFVGGFGAVMVIRYRSSPVGPYDELLFVPGRFDVNVQGRVERHWSVTDILVSTTESVVGGRRNWGLPKEPAAFDVSRGGGGGMEIIRCTTGGRQFFEAKLRAVGPRVPVFTWPWRFSLVQVRDGRCFVTRIRGRGWVRAARARTVWTDGTRFADLTDRRPLFAVRVEAFRMVFPPARIAPWRQTVRGI